MSESPHDPLPRARATLLARLWAFLNQQRLDKEFDDELKAHLQLATERHVDRGVPLPEARRLAVVELGGVERAKQLHREARGLPRLETLLQDVRYAGRALIRSPRFTVTTVVTLTICIALNAAVFTVANAVLFRGFRTVPENQQLLYIGTQRNGTGCCVSYPDFADWRQRVRLANAPTLAWSEGLLDYTMDSSVALYACGLAVVAAVLFGLGPAFRVSSLDVHATLKNGGRGTSRRNRLASALIGAEVAVALILLAASVAVVQSFSALARADLGITPDERIVFSLSFPTQRFPSADARLAVFEALETRVGRYPGIESFAVATALPTGSAPRRRVIIEAAADQANEQLVGTLAVSPHYFPTVGASLIAGRDFNHGDNAGAFRVAIVNQRFLEEFLAGREAIGRRIGLMDGNTHTPVTIVGVASNILQNDPSRARRQFEPLIYLPLQQAPPQSAWVIVRTGLPLSTVSESLRREAHAVDPELPIWNGPFEMKERLDGSGGYWQVGINASLLALSASVATLLAAIGVYALISHRVGARRQEIGIRIALGGTGRQIVLLVLRQTGMYVALGLAVGVLGSFGVLRVISSYVAGVHPTDFTTLVAASFLLAAIAALACLVPARRALHVKAVEVLRDA